MSDPWEQITVTITTSIPRWMLDNAREDYGPLSAEDVVAAWIENMEANTYDCARDDGRLPVPPFEAIALILVDTTEDES